MSNCSDKYTSELSRLSDVLSWRFQYIKRRVLRESYNPYWDEICEIVSSWEDDEYGSDTYRFVANAIWSQRVWGDSSYDLARVPSDILPFYNDYTSFSAEIGYYLDDVLDYNCPLALAKYVQENEAMPHPPIPLCVLHGEEGYLLMKITVMIYHANTDAKPDQLQNKELNRLVSDLVKQAIKEKIANVIDDECSFELKQNKSDLLLVLNELNEDFGNGKTEHSDSVLSDLVRLYKKLFPFSFKKTTNLSRCQGLYMWDCKNFHNIAANKAIRSIREVVPSDENGNPDDMKIRHWGDEAERCIVEGKVLAMR